MLEITILGSSSGNPSENRANASFVIKAGNDIYQFDAGDGVSSSILKNKINHNQIINIFISHTHPDHIMGIFLEIQMMHLANRIKPLNIYMPDEIVNSFKEFLTSLYLFPERMGFDLNIHSLKSEDIISDDKIKVTSYQNSHLALLEGFIDERGYKNRMQSFSFVIELEGKKIVYSGDIGSIDDYMDLVDDCDLLITEGLHADINLLVKAAVENEMKELVLTHLSQSMFENSGEIFDLCKKYGYDKYHIAHDGFKITI